MLLVELNQLGSKKKNTEQEKAFRLFHVSKVQKKNSKDKPYQERIVSLEKPIVYRYFLPIRPMSSKYPNKYELKCEKLSKVQRDRQTSAPKTSPTRLVHCLL